MLNIFPPLSSGWLGWLPFVFWSRTHKTCFPLELSSLAPLPPIRPSHFPIRNANERQKTEKMLNTWTYWKSDVLTQSICQKVYIMWGDLWFSFSFSSSSSLSLARERQKNYKRAPSDLWIFQYHMEYGNMGMLQMFAARWCWFNSNRIPNSNLNLKFIGKMSL